MNSLPDYKDIRALGGNPCLEQTLESYELCCLVETFPNNHETLEDFLKTLKYAFLYAKTVTLGETHWERSNRVTLRNRRIGTSLSGLAQFISSRGLDNLRQWCEEGYSYIQQCDSKISEWLTIPKSIKTTCIKPSGTVSLLAGATPGMHYPISAYYLRRVRLPANSELVEPLKKAGYTLEPASEDPKRSLVVEIPICCGNDIRSSNEISMWEQLSLAAFLQRHWADNQVSCTVTFDTEKEGSQLKYALEYFQYHLKGISFLPSVNTSYQQMPYEEITKERYEQLIQTIRPVEFTSIETSSNINEVPDKFCDSTSCDLK